MRVHHNSASIVGAAGWPWRVRGRSTGVIMVLRGHFPSVEEPITKDESIVRLRLLGGRLDRDVSPTGTKEELALRVAELEEELNDADETVGQDTPLSRENVSTGYENEMGSAQPDAVILDTSKLVIVAALVRLHTDALHATRDEPMAFVLPGAAFRVSVGVVAEITERGLTRMQ